MLTLKLINEETERVIKGLKKKHFENAEDAIAEVIETDRRRREAQQKLDSNLSETKKLSARIGMLMKDGKKDEAEEIKKNVTALKEISKQLEAEKAQCEKDLTLQLCSIPNIPNDDVPEGRDASDNVVVKEGGCMPELPEDALCHWDLCKKFNLIDFDLGVKITGAGFPVYIGKMARFQRALEAFSLKRHARADIWRFNPHTW